MCSYESVSFVRSAIGNVAASYGEPAHLTTVLDQNSMYRWIASIERGERAGFTFEMRAPTYQVDTLQGIKDVCIM